MKKEIDDPIALSIMEKMDKIFKNKDCVKFKSWRECYHTCGFYPVCRRYYRVMENDNELD